MRVRNLIVPGLCTFVLATSGVAQAGPKSPRERAIKICDRIQGVPISLSDPRLPNLESLVAAGKEAEAAAICAQDDAFYNVTLRRFFTVMSNREEDPTGPLTDFVATGIGIVRDNRDARELLTGDSIYKADLTVVDPASDIHSDDSVYMQNKHYQFLEGANTNLRKTLIRAPQKAYDVGDPQPGTGVAPKVLPDTAGLLTTRQFILAHVMAGTNRRPLEFAFREFLCSPISEWADATIPDDRVGLDVDRVPGGSVKTYITSCRGCHAPMDGMRSAFAYFETTSGNTVPFYLNTAVIGKLNQKAISVNKNYRVLDDSWINRATSNHNVAFGWSGALEGKGVHSLGVMLANSKKFGKCMAKRAFQEMCRRAPATEEEKFLNDLAAEFEANGHNLRVLFERSAIYPNCLGSRQ